MPPIYLDNAASTRASDAVDAAQAFGKLGLDVAPIALELAAATNRRGAGGVSRSGTPS